MANGAEHPLELTEGTQQALDRLPASPELKQALDTERVTWENICKALGSDPTAANSEAMTLFSGNNIFDIRVAAGNTFNQQLALNMCGKGYGELSTDQRYLVTTVEMILKEQGINVSALSIGDKISFDFDKGTYVYTHVEKPTDPQNGELERKDRVAVKEKSTAERERLNTELAQSGSLFEAMRAYGDSPTYAGRVAFINAHPGFVDMVNSYLPAGSSQALDASKPNAAYKESNNATQNIAFLKAYLKYQVSGLPRPVEPTTPVAPDVDGAPVAPTVPGRETPPPLPAIPGKDDGVDRLPEDKSEKVREALGDFYDLVQKENDLLAKMAAEKATVEAQRRSNSDGPRAVLPDHSQEREALAKEYDAMAKKLAAVDSTGADPLWIQKLEQAKKDCVGHAESLRADKITPYGTVIIPEGQVDAQDRLPDMDREWELIQKKYEAALAAYPELSVRTYEASPRNALKGNLLTRDATTSRDPWPNYRDYCKTIEITNRITGATETIFVLVKKSTRTYADQAVSVIIKDSSGKERAFADDNTYVDGSGNTSTYRSALEDVVIKEARHFLTNETPSLAELRREMRRLDKQPPSVQLIYLEKISLGLLESAKKYPNLGTEEKKTTEHSGTALVEMGKWRDELKKAPELSKEDQAALARIDTDLLELRTVLAQKNILEAPAGEPALTATPAQATKPAEAKAESVDMVAYKASVAAMDMEAATQALDGEKDPAKRAVLQEHISKLSK